MRMWRNGILGDLKILCCSSAYRFKSCHAHYVSRLRSTPVSRGEKVAFEVTEDGSIPSTGTVILGSMICVSVFSARGGMADTLA